MTRRYTGTRVIRRDGAETRRRIRDACRTDRVRLTEDARARREALRDAIREERAALRGRCATRLAEARAATDRAIEEARASALHLDKLRRVTRSPAQQHAAERARARLAERIRERDDEVRRQLSPDLQIVWQAVRQRIKKSPRRTRLEAFLEWVEEHQGDAARILDEHASSRWGEESEAQYRARTHPAAGRVEDVPEDAFW